jgi:hypothetical protein
MDDPGTATVSLANVYSQDSNQQTATYYDERSVVNDVNRGLLHGSEHFDDIVDEEIVAEQRSLVRLQMRRLVQASGLHRPVYSLQNRSN